MNRQEKQEMVAELRETFSQAQVVVVTHYKGLTVSDMSELRGKAREAGAGFRVTKNRLTRLALKDTSYESLADLFTGPTAVAYANDPVAAAKATVEFAKKNEKLVILGGAMGDVQLNEAQVKELASLPSLDELRGKLVGLLQAPAQKLASVTQAPAGQLARVFNAYADKGEAA